MSHARAVALGALALSPLAAPATAQTQSPSSSPAPASAAQSAPTATAAKASKFKIRTVRRTVVAGRTALVRGTLSPGLGGKTVALRAKVGRRWRTVDKSSTARNGVFSLRGRLSRPGTHALRVTFVGDRTAKAASRVVGRVNVYRRAFASWYGPGLYGNKLGCGGRLHPGTVGVAHKTLPCGTRLTLRHRGRVVRTRVIDRGPYVGGREFDLTAATKQRLGFGSTGYVLSTR